MAVAADFAGSGGEEAQPTRANAASRPPREVASKGGRGGVNGGSRWTSKVSRFGSYVQIGSPPPTEWPYDATPRACADAIVGHHEHPSMGARWGLDGPSNRPSRGSKCGSYVNATRVVYCRCAVTAWSPLSLNRGLQCLSDHPLEARKP